MLQPIRFNNPDELDDFILLLEDQELVSIENKDGAKCIEFSIDSNPFIKTYNGDTYYLHQVQEFVNQASEAEMEAFADTFMTRERQDITLAQLKAEPDLFNDLLVDTGFMFLLKLLNASLYIKFDPLLFNSVEDVKNLQVLFSNTPLIDYIQHICSLAKMGRTGVIALTSLLAGNLGTLIAPDAISPTFQTTSIMMDVLKSSLIQEIKLKHYLLEELLKKQTIEVAKALEQWIHSIDHNIQWVKYFLKTSLQTYAETHARVITAVGRNELLLEEDFCQSAAQVQIELLRIQIDAKKEKQTRKKDLVDTVKSVVFYGIGVALPLLALTLTFVLVFFMISFYAGPLYAPAAILLWTVPAFFILFDLSFETEILSTAATKFRTKVDDFFDAKLDVGNSDIAQMNKQVLRLDQDIKLVNEFSSKANTYAFTLKCTQRIIDQTDSCLQEAAAVERAYRHVVPQEEQALSYAQGSSKLGLFKEKVRSVDDDELTVEPEIVACV